MTIDELKVLERECIESINKMTPEEIEYLWGSEMINAGLWHEIFEPAPRLDEMECFFVCCFDDTETLVSSYDLMITNKMASDHMTTPKLNGIA